LYDPLKVDVWSLGATTWELVHGDPPFEDVKDTRDIVGGQLPPVREPEAFSRSFHDFLHSCSQPAASRPDPDELLDVRFFFFLPLMEVDKSIFIFYFFLKNAG
jgi:serine/threonine-protein kinase CLA4